MRLTATGLGIGAAPVARLGVVTTNPGVYTGTTAWNTGHVAVGPNAGSATGAALGFGYDNTNGISNIFSLAPGVAWKPMNINVSSLTVNASGNKCLESSNGSPIAAIADWNTKAALQISVANPAVRFGVGYVTATDTVELHAYDTANSVRDIIINRFGGKIGINTAPSFDLDIGDATAAAPISRINSSNGGVAQMQVRAAGAMSGFLTANNSGSTVNGVPTGCIGIGTSSSGQPVVITAGAAERLRANTNGSIGFKPTTTPGSAVAGDVYYDSGTNKLRCYNGTTWNDLF
jgi:hypothetical protein